MDSRVYVGPSAIHGAGVFTQTAFRPGDAILEIDDSRVIDDSRPLGPGDDAHHCDYLAGGAVILMQNPERHINHSCDPNTYVRTIHGRRIVLALRAIAPGEEITYDYCINSSGDTLWMCHCQAARCRRTIHSDFFHLPLDLQREYLPLLEDWFRREQSAAVAQLERALSHGSTTAGR